MAEHCIFFVDNKLAGANNENAGGGYVTTGTGGGTQTVADAFRPTAAEMARYMQADGSPLASGNGTYDANTGVITADTPGVFNTNMIDLYVAVHNGDISMSERFRVLFATADTITIDAGFGWDIHPCTFRVGGALATAEEAVSWGSVTGGPTVPIGISMLGHNYIHYSCSGHKVTHAGTFQWVAGGYAARGYLQYFLPYYTNPGDMAVGGQYHPSAADNLRASLGVSSDKWANPDAKWIEWDGNGGNYDLITASSGASNVVVGPGMLLRNVSKANSKVLVINQSGNLQNWLWWNCRFNDAHRTAAMAGGSYFHRWTFLGCGFGSGFAANTLPFYTGRDLRVLRCGFVAGAGNVCLVLPLGYYGIVDHCVFVGAGSGAGTHVGTWGDAIITNNVFYRPVKGIDIGQWTNDGPLIRYNNVFVLDDDGAVAIYGGSVNAQCTHIVAGYDFAYYLDGTQTGRTPFNHALGLGDLATYLDTIGVNPKFADPDNGDFSVRAGAVMAGGMPGLDGRSTPAGPGAASHWWRTVTGRDANCAGALLGGF